MSEQQNAWIVAKLTLAPFDTTQSALTVYFSNQSGYETTPDPAIYPLLVSANGVGVRLSGYLAQTDTGSITLDNSPNSIGFQRKFSDLLQRYTIIQQTIQVYSFFTPFNNFDIGALLTTGNTDFVGKIASYSLNPASGSISIRITSNKIHTGEKTKLISSDLTSSVPDSALGKYIPLVFGTGVEVRPVRVGIMGAGNNQPIWAYATNLADTFEHGGVTNYYFKNHVGDYVEVTSQDQSPQIVQAGSSPSDQSPNIYEWASSFSSDEGKVISLMQINVRETVGARTGRIEVSIREAGVSGVWPKMETIASGSFNKADIPLGTDDYVMKVTFNKAVIISADTTYFLCISQDGWDTSNYVAPILCTVPSYTICSMDPTKGVWGTSSSSTIGYVYGLYACNISEAKSSTTDSRGFRYSYSTIVSGIAIPISQVAPDLIGLDCIFKVDGLEDDDSGTITGAANATITKPHHVAELLDYAWNGSAWAALGDFNASTFSGSHAVFSSSSNDNYRNFSGRFLSRTSSADMYGELCKATMCRIARDLNATSSNTFGLWAWGISAAVQAVLTAENSNILSVDASGTETIVNAVALQYDERLLNNDYLSAIGVGAPTSFAGTLFWNKDTSTGVAMLCEDSDTIFGEKLNATAINRYINDSQSAEAYATWLLSVFALPHVFVDITAPLAKFRTLEIFDIIEILHPDLPAFFGTTAMAKAAHYEGDPADVLSGHYLSRAQRHRAQIEAKQFDYNAGGAPEIRLTCRLLTNYPTDPT